MRLSSYLVALASSSVLAQATEEDPEPQTTARYGLCSEKYNHCTTYAWSGKSFHKIIFNCPANKFLRCPGLGRNLCKITYIKGTERVQGVNCRLPKAKQLLIDNNQYWGTEPSHLGLL